MLIEENQELFSDLPDDETPANSAGEKPSAEDIAKERELNLATKTEETRAAKAKAKLDEVRAERRKVEAELAKAEAGEDAEPKKEEPVNVTGEVQKILAEEKRKAYLKSVADEIRKTAKTQREAKEAYEMAIKLPSTDNPKLDADFAFDRVQKLKNASRGFQSPSIGGSFADLPHDSQTQSPLGMHKDRVDHLKRLGLTEDEIKKYKDGVDLTRAFRKN